jgi:hypothetical protein
VEPVVVVGVESVFVVSAGGVCWAGVDWSTVDVCDGDESLDDDPLDDVSADDDPLDEVSLDDESVAPVWSVAVVLVSAAKDDVSAALELVSAALELVSATWVETVPAAGAMSWSAALALLASTAAMRHAKSAATVTRPTRRSPQVRLIALPSGKGDRPPKVEFPERDARTSIGRRETGVHRRTDLFPVQRSACGIPVRKRNYGNPQRAGASRRATTTRGSAAPPGGSMQLHGCA